MLKKLLRSKDSVLFYAVLIALEFAYIFAAPAKELKVTVIDGELEIPLEGAKVFLNENRAVSADTDMDGNAVLVFEDEFDGGNLICQFPGYYPARTYLYTFSAVNTCTGFHRRYIIFGKAKQC